ncbi:hypothetical protein DSECCO2_430040 [anaerobic digester metagenome]
MHPLGAGDGECLADETGDSPPDVFIGGGVDRGRKEGADRVHRDVEEGLRPFSRTDVAVRLDRYAGGPDDADQLIEGPLIAGPDPEAHRGALARDPDVP